MSSYLFYDIETTGLNKAFDQVVQFAAIRTDLNLNERERFEFKIKLNPDMIPSPYALLTHKLSVEEAAAGINEFEAIKQIHQLLNTKGTISLGYNTLGFDDEFLRFSFFRNLLKPYTHQFANACGRMDIFPMAIMFYLFKDSVIQWPTKENKISFKLEEINRANQLIQGRAHDAMIDVEITLALAKRFFQEKEMWDYLTGYFNKQIDQERLQPLLSEPALLVDSSIGTQQSFQTPVLYLGNHLHYKNQQLWLRLECDSLKSLTPESIKDHTRVIHKKVGEPHFILPLKERFLTKLSDERRLLMEENHLFLTKNPQMLEDIYHYYANYQYPLYENTDVEASLYLNGFWNNEEEALCQLFHSHALPQKAHLLERMTNQRLRTLALRVLGRHYPETLLSSQKEEFNHYLKTVYSSDAPMVDHRGKKRFHLAEALEEINQIKNKEGITKEDLSLLNSLERYLTQTKTMLS